LTIGATVLVRVGGSLMICATALGVVGGCLITGATVFCVLGAVCVATGRDGSGTVSGFAGERVSLPGGAGVSVAAVTGGGSAGLGSTRAGAGSSREASGATGAVMV